MTGPNPRKDQKRGATKKSTTKKGGKRIGAGRKPNEISSATIDEFIRVLNEKEKEHGTSWIEECSELIWSSDKSAKTRMTKELIKMFTVQHTAKEVTNIEIKEPSIGLPTMAPDLAKVVKLK